MLNQDTLREATRLTQAGQLAEATALLQHMLRGERAPDATTRTLGRVPCLAANRLPSTRTLMTLRKLLPRALRGPHPVHPAGSRRCSTMQRMAPGSVCEGRSATRRPRLTSCQKARNSSKALTATRREVAPTSSSSQADIRDNRFPWS